MYVHAPEAVLTRDGRPFVAFAPFRRAWEALPVRDPIPAPARIRGHLRDFHGDILDSAPLPPPEAIGAVPSADPALLPERGEPAARTRLETWLDPTPDGPLGRYASTRDRLDLDGTSHLSIDLRWGTISPTELLLRAGRAGPGPERFATELCWREFYGHLLWHQSHLRSHAYHRSLEDLAWRDDPSGVEAWRAGLTGYPIVDAAMRQLSAAGWMPNRARMIAASFLVKDLLVDWRIGERHFMEHLVDGDVASNTGNWQWVASTGPDAQPAFRIMNPVLQARRSDPDGAYVRRWVPEVTTVPGDLVHEPWRMSPAEQRASGCRIGVDYPAPIVDHAAARARVLEVYSAARRASQPPVSARRTS
jgi:deoxyribodipyrimidine photo-lyase